MTIAVTGGTGFVGQALLESLHSCGYATRALARTPPAAQRGVEWVQGSLSDAKALDRLLATSEAVIHVAGVVNAPDAAGFEAGNAKGTLAVVEAALRAGTRRFIHVSSLAAREPQLSAYGASKRRAEAIVAGSALDWTIVRPPAVYGPRDREMLELFRAARWGIVPMPPEGRASLIHVRDLAELLVRLITPADGVSQMIVEPDDGREQGWPHRELGKAIGRAVGRKVWVPHLPRPMLDWAAKADRMLRGEGAKLTPDRVGYMTHPDWVSRRDSCVPASIWQPRKPTLDGLRETAAWYCSQGWL